MSRKITKSLSHEQYCWGGSLSGKEKVLLSHVVQSASKMTGMTLPIMDELYESYVTKKTTDI